MFLWLEYFLRRWQRTNQPQLPKGSVLTPTHITLRFSEGSQAPTVEGIDNIWRWYALANVRVQLSAENPPKREVSSWTVFLTLDRAIETKQVHVEITGPKPIPSYEVKDRDSRSAVLVFSGDMARRSATIKLLTEPVYVVAPPQAALESDIEIGRAHV